MYSVIKLLFSYLFDLAYIHLELGWLGSSSIYLWDSEMGNLNCFWKTIL